MSCVAQTLEVYTEGLLKGVQTKDGNRITEALFTDISFYERYEYISVKCGEKWGCLDLEGLPITEIKYDKRFYLDRGRDQLTEELINRKFRTLQKKMPLPDTRQRFEWQILDESSRRGYGSCIQLQVVNQLNVYQDRGRLSIVSVDSKYGALDAYGKEVISPQYDYLSNFNHGLSFAKKGDEFAIINRNNETVLPYQAYDRSPRFIGDSLILLSKGKKSQMIDLNFELIGEEFYDHVNFLNNELVVVIKENLQGLLNYRTNEFVLPIKYDRIVIEKRFNHPQEDSDKEYISATLNNQTKLYETNGIEVNTNFLQYYALNNDYFLVTNGKNVGVVNQNGDTILPLIYYSISNSRCNSYIVQKERGGLFAMADLDGNMLTDFSFTSITGCNSRFVAVELDSLHGLLNSDGAEVIPPSWKEPIRVFDGTTIIRILKKRNGSFRSGAYFMETGKTLEPTFNQIRSDDYGIQVIKDDLKGFILNDGTNFLPINYKWISRKDDWFIAQEPAIDYRFKTRILSPKYKGTTYTINQLEENHVQLLGPDDQPIIESAERISIYRVNKSSIQFLIKQRKKFGLIDETGQVIIPIKYDKIDPVDRTGGLAESYFMQDGVHYVWQKGNQKILLDSVTKIQTTYFDKENSDTYFIKILNGKQKGMIDKNGTVILPCKYNQITYLPRFNRPLFIVVQNGLSGIVDATNSFIIEPSYKNIYPMFDSDDSFLGFAATKDGKTGILAKDGQQKVPFLYDRFEFLAHRQGYGPLFLGVIDGIENYYRMDGSAFKL